MYATPRYWLSFCQRPVSRWKFQSTQPVWLRGPLADEVLWNLPCMAQTPNGFLLLRDGMANLGTVVTCLHQRANGWNNDDTVTVLEELMGECTAALLIP